MKFTITISVVASLLTVVAGDACVSGGPADTVSDVGRCCYRNYGTWFQNFPNQAICVVNNSRYQAESFKKCVENGPLQDDRLNFRCIPGDGGLPTPSMPAPTGRETITAA